MFKVVFFEIIEFELLKLCAAVHFKSDSWREVGLVGICDSDFVGLIPAVVSFGEALLSL